MDRLYIIGGGALLALSLAIGAYFYGVHVGHAEAKAGQLDGVRTEFQGYVTAAGVAAATGTAGALAEFKEQAATLASVANDLQRTNGVMNNAAAKLSASLRGGACILTPAQRRLLECVRRPNDTACTAPSL